MIRSVVSTLTRPHTEPTESRAQLLLTEHSVAYIIAYTEHSSSGKNMTSLNEKIFQKKATNTVLFVKATANSRRNWGQSAYLSSNKA